jgi:hypothetical protein
MRKASALWLAASADVLVTHAAQLNPLHAETLAVKFKTHFVLRKRPSRMVWEIRFTRKLLSASPKIPDAIFSGWSHVPPILCRKPEWTPSPLVTYDYHRSPRRKLRELHSLPRVSCADVSGANPSDVKGQSSESRRLARARGPTLH